MTPTGGILPPFFMVPLFYFKAAPVPTFFVIRATPPLLRLCPYYRHWMPRKTCIVCHFLN